MIVPVTVIGSVVVASLLCVELVWANASGAISITTRVTIVLFMMPPFYWASFCSRFGLNRSHFLFLPQPTFASSAAHIVARVCNTDWWPTCSLVDLNLRFSTIAARDKGFPDNDYECARETFRTISGRQTASKMI